jgi:hypothetical protein
MTKDEASARSFEAARCQQKRSGCAVDYGPALCVLGLIDAVKAERPGPDEGRRAIALTPLKDVNISSHVLQFPIRQRGRAKEPPCSNWKLDCGSLRMQTGWHMGALKLLPFWDPLRGDPRFENRRLARAER